MLYSYYYLAWVRAFLKYLLADQIFLHCVFVSAVYNPPLEQRKPKQKPCAEECSKTGLAFYQPHLLTLAQLRHFKR